MVEHALCQAQNGPRIGPCTCWSHPDKSRSFPQGWRLCAWPKALKITTTACRPVSNPMNTPGAYGRVFVPMKWLFPVFVTKTPLFAAPYSKLAHVMTIPPHIRMRLTQSRRLHCLSSASAAAAWRQSYHVAAAAAVIGPTHAV